MTSSNRSPGCGTCALEKESVDHPVCSRCMEGPAEGRGLYPDWRPVVGDLGRVNTPSVPRQVTLPEDQNERDQMCLFDGFMAYFPNAMAEVAKLSYAATQQHHPDQPMHWDRSKSLDHLNKIGRHMIDAGKLDDKGQRHSAALAWRAMANLQEELERDLGLPPSPASRNRPF
jgi:hypothetical protein